MNSQTDERPEQRKPEKRRIRGKGEGSIFRTKDGRWCCMVTLPNGKRKARWRSTQKEALKQLQKILADVAADKPIPDERLKLSDYLANWLAGQKDRVRPKTYEFYEILLRLHIKPHWISGKSVARLMPTQVQDFIKECSDKTGPRTAQAVYGLLRTALNKAVKLELVGRNPVLGVDRPRYTQAERQVFTAAQLDMFLNAAVDHPLRLLFEMAAGLGMRRGELLGLVWGDVDLTEQRLTVRRQLQRIGRRSEPDSEKPKWKLELTEPKSAQSKRTLPLPAYLIHALRAHKKAQRALRLSLGSEWPSSGPDYVFRSSLGTPIDPRNLTRQYYSVLKKARAAEKKLAAEQHREPVDLPLLNFHALRHAAASMLLLAGTHPRVASDLLGHSSVALTMKLYQHVIDDTRREAIDAVYSQNPALRRG